MGEKGGEWRKLYGNPLDGKSEILWSKNLSFNTPVGENRDFLSQNAWLQLS